MSKRILVIDDDEGIRKLFIRALEDTPYRVDTAESGTSGVELKKETEYDLIFLDLNMPDKNGIEVLRAIRMTDKEVPIYIITAFYKAYLRELTDIFYYEKGLKFEVLHKPITINKICLIAMETLEGSKVPQ